MQRNFARKGDKTTANGTVLEGEESFIQEGLPVAFHGAQVYCPACNSTGVVFTIPPHHPWRINDKQLALDGDLCICKCSPPPRLLASQSSAFMSFNENSAATSTRNGANASELSVAVAGLASVAKASSDADYERMRQEAYGDPRYWTAQVGPPAPGTDLRPTTQSASADGRDTVITRSDGTVTRRTGGTLAWRNNNPGNIRAGAFANDHGAIGVGPSGFAVFPDEATGRNAIGSLLRTRGYSNLSIGDAIARYAPPNENNVEAYHNAIRQQTGLDINRTISDLNDSELDQVVGAIRHQEGWTEGSETTQ